MAESISVFVDGACRNNGQENPQGGCGVYWGEESPLNISECLIGEKQTNNRAELTAAIIAVAQAKHQQIHNIQITADSKYVKEGITKWIVLWKANGWKTKQKTDVLNKDLWLLIDCLSREININWCWIEGHADVTGNIKADELAKSGISSKSCYWQKLLKTLEPEESSENKIARESRKSDAQQVKEPRKSDILLTKNFDCGVCKEPVSDDGIQCGDCKLWYHYTCSKLPSYQLYMYEKSQRKYTCEECSNVDGDFSRKYENMMATSIIQKAPKALTRAECETTKSISTSCCTEVGTQILIEHKDISIQTENRNTKDKCIQLDPENRKKTPVLPRKDKETQTPDSFTSISKCLTEFQDGTIQRLENSFVNAVDNFAKVHNNTADLHEQIRKLTQERDTLKLQKQQASLNQDTKKCSCQTLQAKVESLEKETERLKQQCYTLNIEKEIEVSKQRGAMTILNQKHESARAQVEILHQDVETMEKRLKIKNDVILDLEEKVKKQNTEMLKLQDEILSWKMHASRIDDTLLPTSNSEHRVINMTSAESFSQGGKEEKKKTNDHEHISKQEAKVVEDVIDVEKIADKKKVLLLGTSNTRFINTTYLSSSKVEVEKF